MLSRSDHVPISGGFGKWYRIPAQCIDREFELTVSRRGYLYIAGLGKSDAGRRAADRSAE
jgi:hypothetical protein